ncbi:AraC family transcriptional regulator N-terminal domain-containing protein [Pendulispora albinea]|uniref:AraC family transcriptional regulator n=1 Tax=Pendulispora albinea TaxID=2741071 RepID=A0ABZ2M3D6_9BACT
MSHWIAARERVTSLLKELANAACVARGDEPRSCGMRPSGLDGVGIVSAFESLPRSPTVYEPSIVILAQGQKRGYLGDQVYTYDADNYLVLSVPLPFECETFASPAEPLLGISLHVDPATLGELLLEMDDTPPAGETAHGIYANPMTDELSDALVRLLECLRSPTDRRVLGRSIVREMTYRVLCGEQSGGALRALASRHSHLGQISKVLRRIHAEYSDNLDVETLAREAGMSHSTFHHHFRAVTSSSPLQYLKSIRLHKARLLMVQEGLNASVAARHVGYESASQFSREFKRFFGDSPAVDTAKLRAARS